MSRRAIGIGEFALRRRRTASPLSGLSAGRRLGRAVLVSLALLMVATAWVTWVVTDARPWPGGTVQHLDAQLRVPTGWQIERVPAQGPIACATFEDPPTVWLFEDQFETGCLTRSPEIGIHVFGTGPAPGLIVMPLGSVPWEETHVRASGAPLVVNGVHGVSKRVIDPSGARVQAVIVDDLGLHVRASLGLDGLNREVEKILASIAVAPRD